MTHNPVMNSVRSMLWRKNQNFICVIVGKTGSGKSYSALRMGEYIDKNFSLDHVVFNSEEFLKLLNDGNLKRGSCLVLDEIGAAWGRREFMSIESRALSEIFQIIRAKNYAMILTLPHWGLLDKHAMLLAHVRCTTVGIDRKKKQVLMKYKMLKTNPEDPNTIKVDGVFPRIVEDGMEYRVPLLHVNLPSEKLRKAYDRRKKIYINEKIKKALDRVTRKHAPKEKRITKRAQIIKELDNGTAPSVIAKELDVGIEYVRRIKDVHITPQRET